MTNIKQDPELLDDTEEGTGDASAYTDDSVEYDGTQFELPEDFEYVEEEND